MFTAGKLAFTTNTLGVAPIMPIGVKSLMAS
jgi:hypothetical protein